MAVATVPSGRGLRPERFLAFDPTTGSAAVSGSGLTLDRLSKIYGSRGKAPVLAVDKVDLVAGPGEIVGLLGSSGCGKTSTLRMIAGFEDVSEGAIQLGDRPIHGLPPKDRGVAMAFEGYALYPPLTIRDNIGFALLRERRPRDEVAKRGRRDRRACSRSATSSTATLRPSRPASSSGPALLAPWSAAPRSPCSTSPCRSWSRSCARSCGRRIKDYLIEHSMTTVFVTHDQTEAIALADRIAVMEQGILQQYRPAGQPERGAGQPVRRELHRRAADERCRGPPRRGARARGHGPDGRVAFQVPLLRQRLRRGLRQPREAIASASGRTGSVWASRRDRPATVISNQWLGDQATWHSISAAAS